MNITKLTDDYYIIKGIQNFTKKYKNKTTNFNDLNENEKVFYVATISFNYFANFLNLKTTMQRIKSNLNGHIKDNFDTFKNETFLIK